mmetsp:Transcript_7458/g.11991  ORF Transcript_7458/g.11991 Transcript_7458/m.11991 type:complete len:190 (-) Transcript_7458:157-726(-)|eukprot:CAMPEP_0203771854 /NCGR_PEP_ID=MMETSP0099_2-20121227/3665_1 /ASSEMBLY_ACC=CAM_ASM_000209 /TAXON_ID=96639 /ORGANISM=" , Strain NY0313808BC1" /LENGTH=189 /DNA_ID=CAMNT_0050669283 /DNA_START=457 /DNA_END=1026 /DNA_ORIENTATION=+
MPVYREIEEHEGLLILSDEEKVSELEALVLGIHDGTMTCTEAFALVMRGMISKHMRLPGRAKREDPNSADRITTEDWSALTQFFARCFENLIKMIVPGNVNHIWKELAMQKVSELSRKDTEFFPDCWDTLARVYAKRKRKSIEKRVFRGFALKCSSYENFQSLAAEFLQPYIAYSCFLSYTKVNLSSNK